MSETLLLIIFAVAVLFLIFGARKVIASKQIKPLTSRIEAAIRIGLCVVFALIAFAIYHKFTTAWSLIPVASSALIIYAVTHLLDRFILKPEAVS